MNKKILLICTPEPSVIIPFISLVLKPLGFDVYIQCSFHSLTDEMKRLLQSNDVKYIKYYTRERNLIYKIPKFGLLLCRLLNYLELKKCSKYINYVHIHYVNKYRLKSAFFINNKNIKRYASFWGSDLLRQSEKIIKNEKRLLNKLDYISLGSCFLKQAFDEKLRDVTTPVEFLYFGISTFDYIDKVKESKIECRRYFSFPNEKKIITIGYNARKAQQHDKVLDGLKKLKNKEDYFLVFHMGYGIEEDKEYYTNLVNKLSNYGFSYSIINTFLSMEELAKFRIATDIFINAQITDSFCASVREALYTKTQVINASWLHYPEIDLFPLYINEFSDFNEISSLLEKTIPDDKLEWNREKVKERSSWLACQKRWAELYGVNKEIE